MKARLGLFIVVMSAAIAVSAAQSPDPCAATDRQYVRGGIGTTPYKKGTTVGKDITFDDFVAKKYTHAIKTAKDLPSALAPKTRMDSFEATLWTVHGYSHCGSYCPTGPAAFEFYMDYQSWVTPSTNRPEIMFGYSGPDCRKNSPNKDVIDALDQTLNAKMMWNECVGGCAGFLDANLTVVGYGFWLENGLTVKPAIFPVLDVIYDGSTNGGGGGSGGSGGSGGTGGTGGGSPAPPANVTVVPPDTILQNPINVFPGSSMSLPFTFYALPTFSDDISLTASVDADDTSGFKVTVAPSSMHVPTDQAATLTVATAPMVFPRDYHVTLSATTASDGAVYSSSFPATVICDPPMILTSGEPQSIMVRQGEKATVTVSAVGSGPMSYEWYSGHSGFIHFPIQAPSSDPSFSTFPSFGSSDVWVRVRNACGSTDSSTATISVSPPPPTSKRHP